MDNHNFKTPFPKLLRKNKEDNELECSKTSFLLPFDAYNKTGRSSV